MFKAIVTSDHSPGALAGPRMLTSGQLMCERERLLKAELSHS